MFDYQRFEGSESGGFEVSARAGVGDAVALLETTTLGFVEILLCCRALMQSRRHTVTLIYTEPQWVCDFLDGNKPRLFDCIVMNPPFAARQPAWKSLREIKELFAFEGLPQVGPIEAGFVLGAIALLRPRGRLLAILPASLVSSPRLAWVRELMAETGTIRHVHELARFTFPEIESRIYIVVYEKVTRRLKLKPAC